MFIKNPWKEKHKNVFLESLAAHMHQPVAPFSSETKFIIIT